MPRSCCDNPRANDNPTRFTKYPKLVLVFLSFCLHALPFDLRGEPPESPQPLLSFMLSFHARTPTLWIHSWGGALRETCAPAWRCEGVRVF